MLDSLSEKVDGHSVFTDFMAVPPAMDKEDIHRSATRELLRNIDMPYIPEAFEEKLDDRLAEFLVSTPSLRCVFSFVERGGWYSADSFLAWLERKLDSGMNEGKPRQYSQMTLAEFHAATNKDLSLVAADTTRGAMLVLNHRTAPNLPLVWAVRMSMSVPLLWQEVVWQPEWGQYRGRDLSGHTIVDGGLLSNFPIELFLSRATPVVSVMGEAASENVLGVMIDEDLEVPGAESASKNPSSFSVGDLLTVQRISNLINTMTSARDKSVIDEFERLVVRLPARGYGTTEFDMTDERRDLLVEAGRQAMTAYFARPVPLEDLSFGIGEASTAGGSQTADKVALKILE
jgi:predicted acylesterase/phospholipase RssA